MTAATRASLLVVMAFLVLTSPASALPPAVGPAAFGIAPARRYIVGRPGMELTPTTVTNDTPSTYRVSVFPEILSQDLSGAFTFPETPAHLSDSRLALTASPDSFTMPSGTSHAVDLHWNLLPSGRTWLAMGVVFQGTAVGQTGTVHVVTRLLSVNFMTLPGFNRVSGVFTGVFARQEAPRVLQILARVKNTGNTFGAPSDGHLTIRDSVGDVVYTSTWSGSVVLPGAQRDFPLEVTKLLPAGSYTATVSMRFGGVQTSSTSFVLVGPNELPTPAVTIRNFNASGVVGGPAKVTTQVVSSGTAPATVTLQLQLGRAPAFAPGAQALASGQVTYSQLAPGSVRRLSKPLGQHLRKGSYLVFASWTDPTGAPHTLEAGFVTTVGHSFLDGLWSFIKDHLILWVLLLLIGLLIAMATLVRRLLERQRRIEAELMATRGRLDSGGAAAQPLPDEPLSSAPARARPSRSRSTPQTRAKRSAVSGERPTSKRNGTAPKRARTAANGNSAEPKSPRTRTPRTNDATAAEKPKRAAPARGAARKANGAKPNGSAPTQAKTTARKTATPKRTVANGSKPDAASSTVRKAAAPKRMPAGSSKPDVARSAAAKTKAVKTSTPKPAAKKTSTPKPGAKRTSTPKPGAKRTSTSKLAAKRPSAPKAAAKKTSATKPAPQRRTPKRPAAPKRGTATMSTDPGTESVVQSSATVTDLKRSPASVDSTEAKSHRADDLLSLARREGLQRRSFVKPEDN